MANEKVKALIEAIKNLDGNEYEEFLKKLEIVDETKEDEEIVPETDEDKGKEENEMTEDEKQIAKAKEDAKEKGKKVTEAEIDESVGEQEHLDDDEDSQDAKDRVDESEGAKKADEEIAKHEAEDDKKIPNMIREILREELKPIIAEAMKEYGINAGKVENEASEPEKTELNKLESIYNS